MEFHLDLWGSNMGNQTVGQEELEPSLAKSKNFFQKGLMSGLDA